MSEVTEGQWLEGNYPEAQQEHQTTDLQTAIERIDGAQLGGESLDDEPEYRAVELVTNAARRWLNPNIDAVAKLILTQSYKWVKGQSSWEHASDQQKKAAITGAIAVVAAAFTPQGAEQ